MYFERDNDTDRLQSLFIYTHLYLQALIQVPSVTIQLNPGSFRWIPVPFHWIPVPFQWIPVESGGIDAFLQESVGHQKVQELGFQAGLIGISSELGSGVDGPAMAGVCTRRGAGYAAEGWPKYWGQVLVQVGKRNRSEALEALGDQDFCWHWKLISIDFGQRERNRAYIIRSELMSKICGHWRSASSSAKTLFSPTVLLILPR